MITSIRQMLQALLPLIKNTSSTIVIRGLSGVTRVVILLLITRQFGPAEFGRLALVISVVEIFKVMADAGLDIITIRRFSIHRLLSQRMMDNVLALKLLMATAGYLISLILYWVVYRSADGLMLMMIIGLSIFTTLLINTFVSYFQAHLKTSAIIGSNVVSAAAYAAFTLLGIYYHVSLAAFAFMIPASELVNLALTGKVYRRLYAVRLRFQKKIILSLLKESLPSGISGLIVILYLRMDNLMIGRAIGEQGVGQYAAAYRLTEPFLLVFSSLSYSLYATLSKYYSAHSLPEVKRSFLQIIIPSAVIGFLTAAVLSWFSSGIVSVLSEAYRASSGVLLILSWSVLFKAINPQLTAVINSRGKYRLMMAISIVNLVITFTGNLFLIPKYGIRGAAGAVVITEGVNTFIQSICVYSLLKAPQPLQYRMMRSKS